MWWKNNTVGLRRERGWGFVVFIAVVLTGFASMLGEGAEDGAEGLWDSLRQITASKIFSAVIAAVVSLVVIRILLTVLDRAQKRSRLDPSLQALLRNLLQGGLWFVAAIIVLGCLGIEVTSLVAVLSVIGLAFSLALQNFLSNMAGGMQLLASHPFKPGDFVEAGGCSGTVTEVGMFYTKLTSPDNKLIHIPNSTIMSANVINYSAQPTRRVEVKVSASYEAPTERVLALLKEMVERHPLTLADPEPQIHVNEYGDNAIGYVVRVWCATADYWTVYFDLMDGLKLTFDAAGVEMTYPHVNVHMVGKTADAERE